MRAMLLDEPGKPLELRRVPVPVPRPGQVLLRVRACGVCRTDLHLVDGELPDPKLPVIPGHEIVGEVVAAGEGVERFAVGQRVGAPWLGWTCGECSHCRAGRENLCDHARFNGYTLDGGFAEYKLADARYAFPLPDEYPDEPAAPLLCAGLIGYRTWRLGGGETVERLGIYGFGAAGHIVAQIARHHGQEVYAFTRLGDERGQEFARRLGAVWAGASGERPPEELDAALIFAPVGPLMVEALKVVRKGGTVVSGGIHMSDIPSFPYSLMWEERVLRAVANLTRRDGEELLALAPKVPIETHIERLPLEEAQTALDRLRAGDVEGAFVLSCS
ncbi:MAG: zinc-dependent alcohol dehydrogenase family protein [Acidobacteria bacterium]|nr:zinc-dependent alcohol dehydrogenase family protein [Acidobacteriota bacterium]